MKWHKYSSRGMMNNWQDDDESGQPNRYDWRCGDYFNSRQSDHSGDSWHHSPMDWHAGRPLKRRFLFMRFIFMFLPVLFIFMAVILFLLKKLSGQILDIFPNNGILLPVIYGIPMLVGIFFFIVGGLVFRKLGNPLADVMAALDAVANGDLSVRVDESARGEFGKMARSFNRMAEELDNAETNRRNLTADVAHELRTPLHIIQGNLEGMLDGVYEPTKEQITATLDETRLLARLVSDLQTLSLAEAGKLHLHFQPILIPDLIEDTVTGFSLLAGENGINLEKSITGTDEQLTINADPDRLSQVLNNLVANALRYTPRGGSIRLKVEPSTGGLTLTVEDTGSGIPPEDLPYVFDRFWKAEKSRSRHEGTGSGLGLAIARQLVQAHGGTIRVESQPGQGTRFIITLPVDGR
jgi:signal transduction histidine kinase